MAQLTAFDKALVREVLLEIPPAFGGGGGTPTKVEFQFPPIIKSDNKAGKWNEVNNKDAEPIPIYDGASPREIDLQWTYIVTGQQGWNVDKIAKLVKSVRGYFYNTVGSKLIIKFRAYKIVGPGSDYWTFRADSISVNHSDCLVRDVGGIYSLRTDISMRLKMYTDVSKDDTQDLDSGAKVEIRGLQRIPGDINWF